MRVAWGKIMQRFFRDTNSYIFSLVGSTVV